MTPADALGHFRTQRALAEALGLAQSSVAEWCTAGKIPLIRQQQLELLTKGELKADPLPKPVLKERRPMFNYWVTAEAEQVALMPKAPGRGDGSRGARVGRPDWQRVEALFRECCKQLRSILEDRAVQGVERTAPRGAPGSRAIGRPKC